MATVEIIIDERGKAPVGVSYNALHALQRAEPVVLEIAYGESELRGMIKFAASNARDREIERSDYFIS